MLSIFRHTHTIKWRCGARIVRMLHLGNSLLITSISFDVIFATSSKLCETVLRIKITNTVMDKFFPYLEGVDYSKLLLNKEGKYSVTRRNESEQIIDFMYFMIDNLENKEITDATGCMGGDTINFSLHFKKVRSIEMSSENYKILQNNVNTFNLKNVEVYHGDSTKIIDWVSDVLYVDPPWGGPSYRNMQAVELFMGEKRLDVWLEDLMSGPYRPTFIFLKLPFNYIPTKLSFLPNFVKMHEVKIQNFFLVCIEVKN